MKINWIVPLAFVAAASTTHAAEISTTVALVSDYRLGISSQTAGQPAVQSNIIALFDNGFYAGVWGTNIDFGPQDGANLELDWYAGHSGSITEDLSYSATLFYYTFQGDRAIDSDYVGVEFHAYYDNFDLEYQYTNDNLNSSESFQSLQLDYSKPVTENLNIDLHVGYTFGDFIEKFDPAGETMDYSIGVSTTLGGVDLSAAYLFSDIDDDKKVSSGAFQNDDTFLLSISRTF